MNKKGISVVIGYVLLIALAISMGLIVYPWFKSLASEGTLDVCPDGASLYIRNYTCENNTLTITLKNNGRFNLAGYFIRGSEDLNDEIATIDLSTRYDESSGGKAILGWGMVLFSTGNENVLEPNQEKTHSFSLEEDLEFIEIIPGRFQEKDNQVKFVSCSNAKLKELVSC